MSDDSLIDFPKRLPKLPVGSFGTLIVVLLAAVLVFWATAFLRQFDLCAQESGSTRHQDRLHALRHGHQYRPPACRCTVFRRLDRSRE